MRFNESRDSLSPMQPLIRPVGSHLFRVFSITNRCPLELFYRTQLAEWVRLEFDNKLLSFEAINQEFRSEGKALFVAFRVRYLHSDCLIYIMPPNQDDLVKAFEDYCLAVGCESKPLGREVLANAKVEIWNKVKMLLFIAKWENDINSSNIRGFVNAVSGYAAYSVSEFQKLSGFAGGRGLAFAFEMVRIGKFRLDTLCDEAISGRTLIHIKLEGD